MVPNHSGSYESSECFCSQRFSIYEIYFGDFYRAALNPAAVQKFPQSKVGLLIHLFIYLFRSLTERLHE